MRDSESLKLSAISAMVSLMLGVSMRMTVDFTNDVVGDDFVGGRVVGGGFL